MTAEEKINRAKSERLTDEARELRKERRYDEAINKINEAIKIDETCLKAWREMGWVYWELEDFEKCLEIATKVSEKIKDPLVYVDIGDPLHRLGRYEEAIFNYNLALELDPKCIAACNGISLVSFDLNDLSKSEEFCKKTIELDPSHDRAYGRLGKIYERRGDLDSVTKYLERAEYFNPSNWSEALSEIKKQINQRENWGELPTISEMVSYLNRFVCGQIKAKIDLCTAIYNHYLSLSWQAKSILNSDLGRFNVLVHGPSGCGKTYMTELITKKMNVPLVIVTATSFSQTGYVGKNVETIIEDLLIASKFDVNKAEHGIVFIDEVDKIKKNPGSLGPDVSGEGVQNALLTLLEGQPVTINSQFNGSFTVNTSKILFIAAGAFDGVLEIMRSRLKIGKKSSKIGFGDNINDNQPQTIQNDIQIDDFEKFGMIPQLIGRFSTQTQLSVLTREELRSILTQMEGSILSKQKKLFELHGINLEFSDVAIEAVLDLTNSARTGARGLRSGVSKALAVASSKLDIYEKQGINKVIITEETIRNGKDPEVLIGEEKAYCNIAVDLRKTALYR